MKFLVLLAACVLAGCGGGNDEPAPPQTFAVTYEVTGFNITTANVTYTSPQGGTQQTTVRLPATLPPSLVGTGVYSARAGDFLYISAQNPSSLGSVSVTIKANGTNISSGSSNGAFGIATASRSCC